MTQSKKGPIRKKKSQNQVKSQEGIASSNGVEHVAEAQVPAPEVDAPIASVAEAEAPKEVAEESKPLPKARPVETSYIRILGFEFESTITKDEEVLLNKAVESGDLSHISKQLLFKGIQELGHIIEKQRTVYDQNLSSVRQSAADLRTNITELDTKISEQDATILKQKKSIEDLSGEKIALQTTIKENAELESKQEEEILRLQQKLEREISNGADVTIKHDNLKNKVWKYVNLSWFSRLTTDVETFFYK